MSKSTAESSPNDQLIVKRNHGISLMTACLFIVGEVAGAGLLAMPHALMSMGWFAGISLFLLVGCASAFCGFLLGKCWLIIEQQDETLKTTITRNPYAMIGERCFGMIGKVITIISQVIQLFGGAVVQLLLCAEMMLALVQPLIDPYISLTFCDWIVVCGFILLPFSFSGSPVDFSPIAFFAMSSTSLAALLILIACSLNTAKNPGVLSESHISIHSFLLAIGSINFSYSGASCMPTIQNDMRSKKSFSISVVLAYVILILLYVPVSIMGYFRFGNLVQTNIVRNLEPSLLTLSIQGLITGHAFCGYLILLNPVNLNVENSLRIQHSFNWVRCVSRTCLTMLAIFVALTVPKFGKILDLVGASAVSFQSFILPCLFYQKLHGKDQQMSSATRILLWSIVILALSSGIASSGTALFDLFDPKAFTRPCYVAKCENV